MSDTAEGLCPRCLMSAAVKSDAPEAVTRKLTPAPELPDIADAAEIARRLPQFEIVKLLGRGGMGVVYKARQVQLDRVVALKILPPADALSPDFVERFRREARSLAKLSHPNIVHVYDFGEAGGLYYFVMEFVDGVNLREMIRSQRMTPPEALAVVPKICDALQYAHEEGVVHRDIKPENILIDRRGRVKIADFGLAKLLRRDATDATLTQSGMTLGTPRYMAPEQLDKPESVDHRADIYSLGVVFYEMLTGEVPMGRFDPPSAKVQVDVKLDEIVLRSLERDVERRYQHASEVKTDVENVAQAFSSVKSEPSASPEQTLLAQINARSIEMMIAGIALAISGLLGFMFGATRAVAATKCDGDLAGRASLGALYFLPFFLCGIAAFIGSLGMRKHRWHTFALVMSILLVLALPATIIVNHGPPPQIIFFQVIFALYAGIRGFQLLRRPEVEVVFGTGAKPSEGRHEQRFREAASAKFFRWLLWLFLVIGGVMFCWFDVQTFFDGPGAADDRRIVRVGAVQPWLVIGERRTSYAPNFLTVSGVAGIAALIAGLALSSSRALKSAASANNPAPARPSLDHRISEAVTVGFPGWFHRRARWVQVLVQTALGIVIAVGWFALLGYRLQQKSELVEGGAMMNSGSLELGQPWPWMTVKGGPLSHGVFMHWNSPTLWLAFLAAVAHGVSEMLRRARPGFDPIADRRKQRIAWSIAGFFIVLWLVVMSFMAKSVMGVHGTPTPGALARVTGGLFGANPELRIERDDSQIPTARTPGRSDYAFIFTAPPNHRVLAWIEWWKDGKLTVDQQFNFGRALARGTARPIKLHVTMQDGDVASPATAGQVRIDWSFDGAGPGRWMPDPFAGAKMRTAPSDLPKKLTPRPGEAVTLLILTGTKGDSLPSGLAKEEQLRAGQPEIGLVLKARFDPVPESRMSEGDYLKTNAHRPSESEPTAALLRLAEQFGEKLGPFVTAQDIRAMLRSRFKNDADARAKAERMLRDKGAPTSPEAKPEDLVAALEESS